MYYDYPNLLYLYAICMVGGFVFVLSIYTRENNTSSRIPNLKGACKFHSKSTGGKKVISSKFHTPKISLSNFEILRHVNFTTKYQGRT